MKTWSWCGALSWNFGGKSQIHIICETYLIIHTNRISATTALSLSSRLHVFKNPCPSPNYLRSLGRYCVSKNLSPEFLQLQISQRWVYQSGPGKSNIITHVRSVVAHLLGNRANEIDLSHAKNCTCPPHTESC